MAVPSDVGGMKDEHKRSMRAMSAVVDNRPVVERLYSLWHEMKAAGWQDMTYAPKDGTEVEMIEMGSTGIFKAKWYSFGRPAPMDDYGAFFCRDGGQEYPCHGVMWRRIKPKPSS